jgi:hypothetical protein
MDAAWHAELIISSTCWYLPQFSISHQLVDFHMNTLRLQAQFQPWQ